MTVMHAASTQDGSDATTFWGRLNRLGFVAVGLVFVIGLVRVLQLRAEGATLADAEMIVWAFVGGALAVSAQILTITHMYRLAERQ